MLALYFSYKKLFQQSHLLSVLHILTFFSFLTYPLPFSLASAFLYPTLLAMYYSLQGALIKGEFWKVNVQVGWMYGWICNVDVIKQQDFSPCNIMTSMILLNWTGQRGTAGKQTPTKEISILTSLWLSTVLDTQPSLCTHVHTQLEPTGQKMLLKMLTSPKLI